jgi:hypothetical protein
MSMTIATILCAAFVAAIAAVAPGVTATDGPAGARSSVKGDRLQLRPPVPVCTQSAWPNYDINCLSGSGQQGGKPAAVRVIVIERVAVKHLATAR